MKVLIHFFGENDERQAIQLNVAEEEVGFITRANMYEYARMMSKSIGTADYAALPGAPSFRLIRLRCPVADCPYKVWVMLFQEDNPPKCEHHQGHGMEIAR